MTVAPRYLSVLSVVLVLTANSSLAVDYTMDVQPILQAHCYQCHGAEKAKGGLRLDAKQPALRGGSTFGKLLVPGDPEKSPMLRLVQGLEEGFDAMPPKGARLSKEEFQVLHDWIQGGAIWPDDGVAVKDTRMEHWSFQPVARPATGESIDHFIGESLQAKGLTFSPEAAPAELVRRLYLDMTGLLPSPEEAAEFVASYTAAGADRGRVWDSWVNRVLDSPHYGERWARHWLDVVRFAESAGFETNHERPTAYWYRDYVIKAFNEDKPYDEFVFEQLAGDTVGEDAATGFIVGGPYDRVKGRDELLNKMQRQDELSDMVNTTGTAFLGLTMGCAKCHNHKFDPITQNDFYAMQSVFAGVQHAERELRGIDFPEKKAKAAALEKKIAELRAQMSDFQPAPFHGRTILIDDEDSRVTLLQPRSGEGVNPDGVGRGEKNDPGRLVQLPNLSGGTYTWWGNSEGKDVAAYRPGVTGEFRVWLSWGSGHRTHTQDARYVLDRDGDPGTVQDQTEIAKVDQQKFADGTGEISNRALWSGFKDAGVHALTGSSAILVRGGMSNSAITADVMLLQSPGASAPQPRLRNPVTAEGNVEEFAPVKARWVRFVVEETSNGNNPCIDELEIWTSGNQPRNVAREGVATSSGNFGPTEKHKLEHINDGKYGNDYSWISNEADRGWVQIALKDSQTIDRVVWARDREKKYSDRLPIVYRIEVAETPDAWRVVLDSASRAPVGAPAADPVAYDLAGLDPAQAAQARELWKKIQPLEQEHADLVKTPMVYAGSFRQPAEPTRLLFRGDPLAPRDVVSPDSLSAFAGQLGSFQLPPDAPEGIRRVALAHWIIDPKNPLTPRVIVNRLWHYHFGRGLVGTPSDFGHMGFKPTHPALLDWMASELMANGWSLKHLQRLILNSRTYRQSSQPRTEALALDAQSSLLWRFPPRRLEAEAIRDNILLVSGALDQSMFGPGFLLYIPNANYSRNWIPKDEFGPEDMRRMIYATKLRMKQDAIFGAFDCPDAGQVAPMRGASTTPIQALNLYNSGFVLDQARRLAARVEQEAGTDLDAKVRRVYALTLGRGVEGEELREARGLVESHGLASLSRALLNANEFLFLQ